VLAVLGLILVLAALGAFARLRMARRFTAMLERSVLTRIPGYMALKTSLSAYAREGTEELHPAFVDLDNNVVLGLVVESSGTANGTVTVFVPGAPSTTSGAVMMVSRERITPIPGSTAGALRSLSRMGVGLQALRPTTANHEVGV